MASGEWIEASGGKPKKMELLVISAIYTPSEIRHHHIRRQT
jgi:hypothetical protein